MYILTIKAAEKHFHFKSYFSAKKQFSARNVLFFSNNYKINYQFQSNYVKKLRKEKNISLHSYNKTTNYCKLLNNS